MIASSRAVGIFPHQQGRPGVCKELSLILREHKDPNPTHQLKYSSVFMMVSDDSYYAGKRLYSVPVQRGAT